MSNRQHSKTVCKQMAKLGQECKGNAELWRHFLFHLIRFESIMCKNKIIVSSFSWRNNDVLEMPTFLLTSPKFRLKNLNRKNFKQEKFNYNSFSTH
jgi:hypothetical protein